MSTVRAKKSRGRKRRSVDEALAALIASTRRVRRRLSLLEVADWLEVARQGLGSLRAVAERIGLSEEMVRQFATVQDLSPRVKKLVAERKIDSVDIAHRLSKLARSEQHVVARARVAGELNSDDVRAVVALRRSAPRLDIQRVIQRVKKSRNIREYLAYFPVPGGARNVRSLRARFGRVVGSENIRSLSIEGALGTLAVNSQGKRRLAEAAKREGLTKRKLIHQIVSAEH